MKSRPVRQGIVLASSFFSFQCKCRCTVPLIPFAPRVKREPLSVVLTMARLLLLTGIVGFEAAGDEVVRGGSGRASDLWHEGLERLGCCVSVDGYEHGWSGDVVGMREKEREGVECECSEGWTKLTLREQGMQRGSAKYNWHSGSIVPVACVNPNRFIPDSHTFIATKPSPTPFVSAFNTFQSSTPFRTSQA